MSAEGPGRKGPSSRRSVGDNLPRSVVERVDRGPGRRPHAELDLQTTGEPESTLGDGAHGSVRTNCPRPSSLNQSSRSPRCSATARRSAVRGRHPIPCPERRRPKSRRGRARARRCAALPSARRAAGVLRPRRFASRSPHWELRPTREGERIFDLAPLGIARVDQRLSSQGRVSRPGAPPSRRKGGPEPGEPVECRGRRRAALSLGRFKPALARWGRPDDCP